MGFQIENGVLRKYKEEPRVTEVVIPDGVTSIGDGAFQKCNSLTSVTIPNSVSSIGDSAFDGCSSLASITIPGSVSSIGNNAFYDCDSLTSITIPDSVTSIGYNAFFDCISLTSITIPDSVTSIGDGAFFDCISLTSITIPDSVTSIGGCAFSGCSSLTSITIPDSVSSIGRSAFNGCFGLSDQYGLVTLRGVIYDCTNMDTPSILFPDSVTSIGDCAFSGCSSLTSITIPDSVTSIGTYAFSWCSSLTSITIPSSVTSILGKAFDGCTGLKTIIAKTKLESKAFGKTELKNPIFTNDPAMLPQKMRPLAAIGYAENPEEFEPGRKKAHLKYLKSNAAKLVTEALAHPALLRLILENKLLKPEAADAFLEAANEQHDHEAVAMLLDYQANKLTAKEKAQAAQKAETREEKVTDFIFSAEALQELHGKVFVVTGKLTTFISRAEFKACLEACGAALSETLNEQTAYLITNTPNSGSAKNKKAESLGVKKLTEAEFNAMIGRK